MYITQLLQHLIRNKTKNDGLGLASDPVTGPKKHSLSQDHLEIESNTRDKHCDKIPLVMIWTLNSANSGMM